MRRELIESYYEEYQRELERFLESDPEMFTLEAQNFSMCPSSKQKSSEIGRAHV